MINGIQAGDDLTITFSDETQFSVNVPDFIKTNGIKTPEALETALEKHLADNVKVKSSLYHIIVNSLSPLDYQLTTSAPVGIRLDPEDLDLLLTKTEQQDEATVKSLLSALKDDAVAVKEAEITALKTKVKADYLEAKNA